jgi:hypothetical protein
MENRLTFYVFNKIIKRERERERESTNLLVLFFKEGRRKKERER